MQLYNTIDVHSVSSECCVASLPVTPLTRPRPLPPLFFQAGQRSYAGIIVCGGSAWECCVCVYTCTCTCVCIFMCRTVCFSSDDSYIATGSAKMVKVWNRYVHVHVGVLCCFALFVCLTLLASFFLPSHLSFKNMYIHKGACTCT